MAQSFVLLLLLILSETVKCQNYGYECAYKTGTYNLDLCHYPDNGLIIEATNWQYHYLYAPSNLSFYSPETNSYYSVIRIDVNDETNITYLVDTFKYTPNIVASQSILTFEFEYKILNYLCPDQQETTNIYWQCNNSITNYPYYYEIISSGSLYACSNAIFIQSPLACQHNQPPILNYDCIFNKDINNEIYTLDLSKFDAISTSSVMYRPCINFWMTKSSFWTQYAMVSRLIGAPITYAIWDITDIVEPDYNQEENVWSFTYYGTNTKYCDRYETIINWNCSCEYENPYYVTFKFDDTKDCHLLLNVSANSICNKGECDKNSTGCVYYYEIAPNQYTMLNLNELQGIGISDVEQGGITGFVYTPCNNLILCNDLETMAVRKNVNDDDCIQYLAIFNGSNGFKVDYEPNDWIISYSNGEQCDNDNIQFIVNWKCQQNVQWRVSNETFIEECIYQITVYSQYACS
eukprot:394190_1